MQECTFFYYNDFWVTFTQLGESLCLSQELYLTVGFLAFIFAHCFLSCADVEDFTQGFPNLILFTALLPHHLDHTFQEIVL